LAEAQKTGIPAFDPFNAATYVIDTPAGAKALAPSNQWQGANGYQAAFEKPCHEG
jgi:hypothetical protein